MAKRANAKRTNAKRTKRPELSRLELEVMDTVWELGDCTSAEVTESFASKRELAPTTIRSVLSSLRKKGYLKPMPTVERGFRMRATVRREDIARTTLSGLVNSLFQGSPSQAIVYLLENEQLDASELDTIREMVETKKQGRPQ